MRIVALYDALAQLPPSPVVELNRAVAVAMAFGPAAALELVDALASEPALQGYHLLPTVRGDLLAKLGRDDEARAEFERAASLTHNTRERAVLLERIAACSPRNGSRAERQSMLTARERGHPQQARSKAGLEGERDRRRWQSAPLEGCTRSRLNVVGL